MVMYFKWSRNVERRGGFVPLKDHAPCYICEDPHRNLPPRGQLVYLHWGRVSCLIVSVSYTVYQDCVLSNTVISTYLLYRYK